MRWYIKAGIQKFLSIVPYGKDFHAFLQYRYGEVNSDTISQRLREAKELFVTPLTNRYGTVRDLKITEIGTGWVPVLPISLSLMGSQCISADIERLLTLKQIERIYQGMLKNLHYFNDIPGVISTDVEKGCNKAIRNIYSTHTLPWKYLAPVDTSLLPIESFSQDAVVSRLVLQHIPQHILPLIIKETWRALKIGGIAIHKINLHDEYAQSDPHENSIHYLKYSSQFWNRHLNNSIKFLNQERYPYYLRLFEDTGFKVLQVLKRVDTQALAEIPRTKISREFQKYTAEEIATTGFTVILEKLPNDAVSVDNNSFRHSKEWIETRVYV